MKYLSFYILLCLILLVPNTGFCNAAEKPTLMMTALKAIEVSTNDAAIMSDALLNSLVQTGIFQGVERRDLKELLNEMSLSMSDIMNQDTSTIKPGNFKSASVVCLGTIGRIGSSYVLQARCADVNTGKLLGSTSLSCSGSIDCLLGLTNQAAHELAGIKSSKPSNNTNSNTKKTTTGTVSQWHIVTNSEFAVFLQNGGYANRRYWSETGWQFVKKNELIKPAFWTNPRLNLPSQPVTGISFYEGEAYCNWKKSALPTVREGLNFCKQHHSKLKSQQFFWTSEISDMGNNCMWVVKNLRKTFSQKDIRNAHTGLVAGRK